MIFTEEEEYLNALSNILKNNNLNSFSSVFNFNDLFFKLLKILYFVL